MPQIDTAQPVRDPARYFGIGESMKPCWMAASIRNFPKEKVIAKGIAVAEHIAMLYADTGFDHGALDDKSPHELTEIVVIDAVSGKPHIIGGKRVVL